MEPPLLEDDFLEVLAHGVLAAGPAGWVDPLLLLASRGAAVYEMDGDARCHAEVLATENAVYYHGDPDPAVVRRRLFLGLSQFLLLCAAIGHRDSDVMRLAGWLAGSVAPKSAAMARNMTPISSGRTPSSRP